jgi:hypothetical protein
MEVESLGARCSLQLSPQGFREANRPNHGRPSLALARTATSKQHGVGSELRHFPERQQ